MPWIRAGHAAADLGAWLHFNLLLGRVLVNVDAVGRTGAADVDPHDGVAGTSERDVRVQQLRPQLVLAGNGCRR